MTYNFVSRWRRAARGFSSAAMLIASALIGSAGSSASATPLTFQLINVNSTNQSRLDVAATGTLANGTLTTTAQFAAGGSNGKGSMSTLFDDRLTTDSMLKANVTQLGISFPGGSTAVANNTVNNANNNFNLKPNIGGASGTAPGNYGIHMALKPDETIDIPPIEIPDYGTIDLGVFTQVNVDLALRDVVVNVLSGTLPLTPGMTYPQTFASSALNVGLSGNSDTLFGIVLKQDNILNWGAATLALNALKDQLVAQGFTNVSVSSSFLGFTNTINIGVTSAIPFSASVNDEATGGTLEHVGSKLRLTVPVKFSTEAGLPDGLADIISLQLGLSGKLIGETDFVMVDVPEPSTLVMAAAALAGLALAARRRNRARVK